MYRVSLQLSFCGSVLLVLERKKERERKRKMKGVKGREDDE